MESQKSRVAKGAALLDKKKPNWFKRINLDDLQMLSNSSCILGQLGKGDPFKVLKGIGFTYNEEEENPVIEQHGFIANRKNRVSLSRLWKKEINQRLKSAK